MNTLFGAGSGGVIATPKPKPGGALAGSILTGAQDAGAAVAPPGSTPNPATPGVGAPSLPPIISPGQQPAPPPATTAPAPYSPSTGPTGTVTAPGGGSATAPPGSITTSPGYTPDYGNLIQSDPTYAAAQSAAQDAQSNADAQRRAAIRQSYIQYGGNMPSGWTDAYGDIDQATQDAAKANQFSTIAGLSRNYDQSVESFKRALAARGMLQSGDLNYGQDQLDTGYGQQQYDAANAFTGSANSALSGYADVLGTNSRNMASAIQGAEANVSANPAYRPIAPTTANYDAAASAKYGTAIYTDAQGNQYRSDGSVFTGPSAGAGPAPGGGGAATAAGLGGAGAAGQAVGQALGFQSPVGSLFSPSAAGAGAARALVGAGVFGGRR